MTLRASEFAELSAVSSCCLQVVLSQAKADGVLYADWSDAFGYKPDKRAILVDACVHPGNGRSLVHGFLLIVRRFPADPTKKAHCFWWPCPQDSTHADPDTIVTLQKGLQQYVAGNSKYLHRLFLKSAHGQEDASFAAFNKRCGGKKVYTSYQACCDAVPGDVRNICGSQGDSHIGLAALFAAIPKFGG